MTRDVLESIVRTATLPGHRVETWDDRVDTIMRAADAYAAAEAEEVAKEFNPYWHPAAETQ